ANYTTYADGKLPVTIHHTRVDAASRFKIGTWLSELGVVTMHSCSETAGGCVKRDYDGGAPKGPAGDVQGEGSTEPGDGGTGDGGLIAPDASDSEDGGTVSDPPEAPSGPHSDQLPAEDPGAGDYAGGEEDYSDAAAPKKKKKAASGGCSSAPGAPAPTGEMFLALGLVVGAAVIRRRRK
ncbi:MAG: hypothetical protein JWP87_3183, partial [Labilithrix sp.]|nr:hypothetical protein [Labilithrix sp.]